MCQSTTRIRRTASATETPAHPLTISALGRAIWNFLSLEDKVAAILYEAGAFELRDARELMAGEKEDALRGLVTSLREHDAPTELIESLGRATEAFRHARREYRNALGHASPYTAGRDEDGTYRPGLALRLPDGDRFYAGDPKDLHEIAHRIEDAISPLRDARQAVREFVGSSE